MLLSLVKWSLKHEWILPRLASKEISDNMAGGFPFPYTERHAKDFVLTQSKLENSGNYAIEFDGNLVGGIHLSHRLGAMQLTGGLAYWIGKNHWGKGYATAAVRAICVQAREEGLARLETTIFEWNIASSRVLEKNDFKKEGVMRNSFLRNGVVVNRELWSLIF